MVLNPVRAKIVKRPDKWRWSSYRGTAGLEKPHPSLTTDWILKQFDKQQWRIKTLKFERITVNPNVCTGKPCIRGLRFPVSRLLELLGSGETKETILKQ